MHSIGSKKANYVSSRDNKTGHIYLRTKCHQWDGEEERGGGGGGGSNSAPLNIVIFCIW